MSINKYPFQIRDYFEVYCEAYQAHFTRQDLENQGYEVETITVVDGRLDKNKEGYYVAKFKDNGASDLEQYETWFRSINNDYECTIEKIRELFEENNNYFQKITLKLCNELLNSSNLQNSDFLDPEQFVEKLRSLAISECTIPKKRKWQWYFDKMFTGREQDIYESIHYANVKSELRCANPKCDMEKTMEKILKNCSGCKKVYYCDRECQKADWKAHKIVCKNSKN